MRESVSVRMESHSPVVDAACITAGASLVRAGEPLGWALIVMGVMSTKRRTTPALDR